MFRLFLLAGAGAATPPKIETYGMTSDFDFHTPPPTVFLSISWRKFLV